MQLFFITIVSVLILSIGCYKLDFEPKPNGSDPLASDSSAETKDNISIVDKSQTNTTEVDSKSISVSNDTTNALNGSIILADLSSALEISNETKSKDNQKDEPKTDPKIDLKVNPRIGLKADQKSSPKADPIAKPKVQTVVEKLPPLGLVSFIVNNTERLVPLKLAVNESELMASNSESVLDSSNSVPNEYNDNNTGLAPPSPVVKDISSAAVGVKSSQTIPTDSKIIGSVPKREPNSKSTDSKRITSDSLVNLLQGNGQSSNRSFKSTGSPAVKVVRVGRQSGAGAKQLANQE